MDENEYQDITLTATGENTPVNERLDEIEVALDELLIILRPVGPFLAQLPELIAKVGPLIEGIEKSPVLKMLGINVKGA